MLSIFTECFIEVYPYFKASINFLIHLTLVYKIINLPSQINKHYINAIENSCKVKKERAIERYRER